MKPDTVIVTGCDAKYFSLCCELLASLESAFGALPRICILDIGLTPQQAAHLQAKVERVIVPGWDIGAGLNLPSWYRVLTARPFLPNYVTDAEMICWVDCDAWVQRAQPLDALIDAARGGRMGIVEEVYGKGFQIEVPGAPSDPPGTTRLRIYKSETIQAKVRAAYAQCFGDDMAAAYGDAPCFNAGVFALRSGSPSWGVWARIYAYALAKNFHFLLDQLALNIAIRSGAVPAAPQPQAANFTCHLELPWYSEKTGLLTMPGNEDKPLGIVHLCDAKQYALLPVPQFPYGLTSPTPLTHDAFRRFVAG